MTENEGLQPAERLWTPWRMAYVGGETAAPGCVFCTVLADDDDARNLVLHRGDSAFVMMNLYPYNTGHLMIVPHDHQPDLATLSSSVRAEIAELSASFCTKLRLALRCDGFNLGMNLGDVAGAGIADHLHQHVVPRWRGDANFMPIVGSTKVLPELIPVTYAKLRADLARRKSDATEIILVPITSGRTHVVLAEGRLPRIELDHGTSTWAGALEDIKPWAAQADLLGWAGPDHTSEDARVQPALAASVVVDPGSGRDVQTTPFGVALESSSPADRAVLVTCLERGFADSGQPG